MSNTVAIKVFDKTKSLRFGETLTTGSRYTVVVEGGDATCGVDAGLILSTPSGLQMAVAELENGTGTLDLNCDAVLKLERTMPFGTVFTLNAVLRSFDTDAEQNVAVGYCQVIAAWQGRENKDTETVIYYKGEKGDKGETGDPMRWTEMDDSDKEELMEYVAKNILKRKHIQTNTLSHMRDAIKTIADALGAASVRAIAAAMGIWALAAQGAGVGSVKLSDLDLDNDPAVVTNVDFTGLAADAAIGALRGDFGAYTNAADAAIGSLDSKIDERFRAATNLTQRQIHQTQLLIAEMHGTLDSKIDERFSDATNYTNRAALDALETVRLQAEALAATLRGEMENITAGVPRVVTNCVDDILLPRPLIFEYGGKKTASLVAPQYATSPIIFGRADSLSEYGNYTAELYSAGKLRNYAVLIEEIPDDVPKRWIDMTFDELWPSNKIYATPKLYAVQTAEGGPMFEHAWRLTTNDVPCIITLREPQAGTIVIRRDRLNDDEVRTYLRNENGKTYIYERD